jgi:hypothetical protein
MVKIFEQWAGSVFLILALFAVLFWNLFSGPKSIASYLPPDTIAFAEFDARLDGEALASFQLLSEQSNGKWPTVASLVQHVNSFFNVDFVNDIYPWISGRIGFALLGDRRSAIFLEVKDEELALDFFRSRRISGIEETLQEKVIDGVTTYQYPASSPTVLFALGNSVVVASDETAAAAILQARRRSLSSDEAFLRVARGFSRHSFGLVYGKPAELFLLRDNASMSPTVSPVESPLQPLMRSLVQHFSREAVGIDILNDMIFIQHHALFSENVRSKNLIFPVHGEKYRASLARSFSDKTEFFAGGANFKRTSEIIDILTAPARLDAFLRSWMPLYDTLKNFPVDEYAIGNEGGQWKALSSANSSPLSGRSLRDTPHFARQLKHTDDILFMRTDFGELSFGSHADQDMLETLILISP